MYHFPLSNKIRLSIGEMQFGLNPKNLFIKLGTKSLKHQCPQGPDRVCTSKKWPRCKKIGNSGQFKEHLLPKAVLFI